MSERATPEPSYDVVSPEPPRVGQPPAITDGVRDLNDRTVVHLWDGLFKGDELFAIIGAELTRRFPRVRLLDHSVFGRTHGPDERRILADLPAKLTEVHADVALSGLGA